MTYRLKRAFRSLFGIQPPVARDLLREGDYYRLTHDFYGPLRVMAEDRVVGGRVRDGRSLFERGNVGVFRREIRGGKTVLDVGANLGLHSIAIAKHLRRLGRGGRVIAFEPHPEILPLTRFNCSLYSEIEVFERATSDAATTFTMPSILHSPNPAGAALSDHGTLPVESVTIDSLNLHDVEFMKIDVEGHEVPTICGAKETIRRCRPTMVVEIMGGHYRKTAPPEVVAEIERRVQFVCALGYSVRPISKHDYLFRPV